MLYIDGTCNDPKDVFMGALDIYLNVANLTDKDACRGNATLLYPDIVLLIDDILA